MGLDSFDRPMAGPSLSGVPIEALREELTALDQGLAELLDRRQAVQSEISIRIDNARSHLMDSDARYHKMTGSFNEGEKAEAMPDNMRIPTSESTPRHGW